MLSRRLVGVNRDQAQEPGPAGALGTVFAGRFGCLGVLAEQAVDRVCRLVADLRGSDRPVANSAKVAVPFGSRPQHAPQAARPWAQMLAQRTARTSRA